MISALFEVILWIIFVDVLRSYIYVSIKFEIYNLYIIFIVIDRLFYGFRVLEFFLLYNKRSTFMELNTGKINIDMRSSIHNHICLIIKNVIQL